MPYRGHASRTRCAYCELESSHTCRHCRRPLCERHALKSGYQFYVAIIECSPAALGRTCSAPRGALRRQAHRVRAMVEAITSRVPPLRGGSRL